MTARKRSVKPQQVYLSSPLAEPGVSFWADVDGEKVLITDMNNTRNETETVAEILRPLAERGISCESCLGTGAAVVDIGITSKPVRACKDCQGSGKVLDPRFDALREPCWEAYPFAYQWGWPYCDEGGIDPECHFCDGRGWDADTSLGAIFECFFAIDSTTDVTLWQRESGLYACESLGHHNHFGEGETKELAAARALVIAAQAMEVD